MRFEWSSAELQHKQKFFEFGRDELSPGAAQRDTEGRFDSDLWRELASRGFWSDWTAEDGSDTGGMWRFIAGLEGLAEGSEDFGFVLSVIAHAGLIQVLRTHGTDAQRKRCLPLLLEGAVGATAATEPGGGSHVAAIRSTATPTDGGFLLTGEKSHITNAPVADFFLMVGRMAGLGRRDITLFLIDGGAPGLVRGHHEDLLGQRTSPTGSFRLNEVRVTEDDVVGEPGDGLATLYSFLAFDRLMYGVAVAGQMQRHLERALFRVRERESFGIPLAEHEFIQDKIVDMEATAEGSRWMSYAAADALERGDREKYSSLASVAKMTASEGMVRAGLELVQVFGHIGYMRDHGIERVARDAIAIRIAGGTTEMQKKNIFKHLMMRFPERD
ncbi:acyl-CoA dehydrogenase [Nocardiopsis kunsanensis]|uniref:Acyl-CoA dehydrogenase n=1 Tax=Nocardiopsis kunsanensis TaxID=141693 RepID=A0A919CMZ7_9ACTN|nr:acyl-CoA dehydrogenase family protein [Nocardiopsis kunsanensis]GHD37236.1 acyl-CoA dehydrogenase [Nocardiopsis kunsanensis]